MTIPRIDDVARVEVGRYYMVPTVWYPWPDSRQVAVPVIGPRHEDADFLRFPDHHYHADGRFLATSVFVSLGRTSWDRWRTINGTPLCHRDPIRRLHPPIEYRRLKCKRESAWVVEDIYKVVDELRDHYAGTQCKRQNGAWAFMNELHETKMNAHHLAPHVKERPT